MLPTTISISMAIPSRSTNHPSIRNDLTDIRMMCMQPSPSEFVCQQDESLHRKFHAVDHGRGDHEPWRPAKLHCIQRGQLPVGIHSSRSSETTRRRPFTNEGTP